MGILDRPTLPDWLTRYQAFCGLGNDGDALVKTVQHAAQGNGLVVTSPINDWVEMVRAAKLPEESAAKFEAEVAALESWADKYMPSGARTVTTQALWGFSNQLERVVEAVRDAGGAYLRGFGEPAVRLAIVHHVYEVDQTRAGTLIHFTEGRPFGIDENQLSRFVESLTHDGIFSTSNRSRDIVRLTEYGRRWFEEQLVETAKPEARSARFEDAATPPIDRVDVDEITSHLSFMASDELRGYVLDDLKEVNLAFAAGANLSTMILCGSAVEGMVLDVAEQLPQGKLKFASKPNWADAISLPKIVEELAGLGLLTESSRTIALGIGDHRDLVHPNRRRKAQAKIRIHPTTARAMMSLAQLVAHDLHDAAKNGEIEKMQTT